MAQPQQVEEGWPLGLQPVNVRAGLLRNSNFSGSASFNTLLSASQSSLTDSTSSDLDTESTGTFFNARSTTTLGSLMGISRIVNLSRRSIRGTSSSTNPEAVITTTNKNYKFKSWCFSLCPTDATDADKTVTEGTKSAPSLAQFLAMERRACT